MFTPDLCFGFIGGLLTMSLIVAVVFTVIEWGRRRGK
jgi:hypothetical protein